ncbi:hypothetical protein NDU88_007749 [Pleurodeles waltl]|uniref:Uncharacterized protein n=1 Tax=Pleurodeles waltl TaxID=8319 RepID=A0AAV7PSB4_PLEWA|nr:hypothetical protein NDU88_007749 [Pleurodeles waltl]
MDKFIVRAVGIIDKEIELAERRISVSSLRSPPLALLGVSLPGIINDEELARREGNGEVMPCADSVAVGNQGGVDESDQVLWQEYDPLELGALELVPTHSTGEVLAISDRRTRSYHVRNHKHLGCGQPPAQRYTHPNKKGAGNEMRQGPGQA